MAMSDRLLGNSTSSAAERLGALLNINVTILKAIVQDVKDTGGFSFNPTVLGQIIDLTGKVLDVGNMIVMAGWIGTMPHVAKVEITAPYDTLQFSQSSYFVEKTAGSATITVTRTDGSNDFLLANYTVSDGTAIAGQDYGTPSSGVLSFGPNQPTQTFPVPIINNPANTGSRTATLTLSKPSDGAKLGNQATATLTIINNVIQVSPQNVSRPSLGVYQGVLAAMIAPNGFSSQRQEEPLRTHGVRPGLGGLFNVSRHQVYLYPAEHRPTSPFSPQICLGIWEVQR